MTTDTLIAILAAAIAGSMIHRYRGGGIQIIPRFPGRSLWGAALAFGAISWLVLGPLLGAALAGQWVVG